MHRKSPRRHDLGPPGSPLDQLEGRNLVIEALRRGRRKVRRILLDERARTDPKIAEIERLAGERGAPVERVPRGRLDGMSHTGVHNGVIAMAEPLPEHTVASLLDEVFAEGRDPFLVLVDEASYEHNLGAILRSALGAGVDGVVIPVVRGKGLTPVVQRVAMGAAEAVPLVREGISSALATLRRAGVRIVGADMDGVPVWDVPMRGSIALVVGGESKGLSPTLRARCDAVAAVPLGERIESLNLSVTAGILMFEKVRQDRT
jgi:23S rRNA (guanosine2251-2'-O)-methyltransferase